MKKLKTFSLYFYQLNKSSSDLTNSFLVLIEFLESVPTFMEMGFVQYVLIYNNVYIVHRI